MSDLGIKELITLENYDAVSQRLGNMTPDALVPELVALNPLRRQLTLFRLLTPDMAAKCLALLPQELATAIADELSDDELPPLFNELLNHGAGMSLKPLLDKMDNDDVTDLINSIAEENLKSAIHLLSEEQRAAVYANLDDERKHHLAAALSLDEQADVFRSLAKQDDEEKMREVLQAMDPPTLTQFLTALNDDKNIMTAVKFLPRSQAAAVFIAANEGLHERLFHLMEKEELWDILNELLESGNNAAIRREFSEMNSFDISEFIEQIDEDKLLLVFRLMSKDQAAEVFTYFDSNFHRKLLKAIGNKCIGAWVNEMATDDAVDFLQELPSNMVRTILREVSKENRAVINEFLNYPKSSAGSLMTSEFIVLFETHTCKQALEEIRKKGLDSETIYTCYITDAARHLTGIATLRSILLASEETPIEEIMVSRQKTVVARAREDQEDVAARFKEYDLMTMPVVDDEDHIVGIITIDDIIDVMVAEQTEDVETMAGMKPSQGAEYLESPVTRLARNRIVWLLVLMVSSTFTGVIIDKGAVLLNQIPTLAAFLPLLMGTGGNCGEQASTLIVRGMALGEIELKDWPGVLWRELRVGILCALALAVVNMGRIWLLNYIGWQSADLSVNLIVNLTLVGTVVFAKVIGGSLPMFAKLVHADPALMASPALTTCVDTVTVFMYLCVARYLYPLLSTATL